MRAGSSPSHSPSNYRKPFGKSTAMPLAEQLLTARRKSKRKRQEAAAAMRKKNQKYIKQKTGERKHATNDDREPSSEPTDNPSPPDRSPPPAEPLRGNSTIIATPANRFGGINKSKIKTHKAYSNRRNASARIASRPYLPVPRLTNSHATRRPPDVRQPHAHERERSEWRSETEGRSFSLK